MRTTAAIHALDHKHHVTRVFTLPTDIDRRSSVDWYELGNGQAIAVVGPVAADRTNRTTS